MQVAILGCGQLARMMALAGIPMGMRFSFLAEPDEDASPVNGLGPIVTLREGVAVEQLYRELGQPEVMTVEREQIEVARLQPFSELCPVYPPVNALYQCQNRWRQKQMLMSLEVSHTPCVPLREAVDLNTATDRFGFPLVIKHTEEGYDGKAQWRLHNDQDVAAFAQQAQWREVSYLAEPTMNFEREVSFLAARSPQGDIRFYPPTENVHRSGVLLHSVAPAQALPASIAEQAQAGLARIQEHLEYVGMMAMECFVAGDQWWVNELAPRVHNSGHWTMQAGLASQFENHMRAVAGWPLGSTRLQGAAGMLNLLGIPLDQKALLTDDVSLHWYNKSVRPGRKLGHLILQDADVQAVRQRLLALNEKIYGDS
ncbi:5-(carboxyamino)imidazole ribonucleotide synthase [Ketobacter sp.]|uniref:5-(carboxyamino)imidazole ribonucleotide synthase n=1 Tax=Ketobacter sp. TaxID=2083498 RepID=UPI000F1B3ADF|nr:5-(carboxyamino)imidazole ribonucleotide synthase [Ketobacter sp.]RLU02051.1 MAG: 5-(carboxyamino)imidazole ribonucleotide synthase [Ketobacter sp.]